MRAGGELRGNNRDRRRRREWLLSTFDTDLGDGVARCHLKLSPRCHLIVDEATMSVDRIIPAGTYARSNIRPACVPCQNAQGALITNERRHQWHAWMDQARAEGIEWDGVVGA